MKQVELFENMYELIKDDKQCFNLEEINNILTDYFEPYDYIFGDYAYEKLRLKGFYNSTNEKSSKINDINKLEEYKKNYCSYGAKTFLLKKITKRL